MRFYTQQHPFYCGIDLHARTMYLCILDQAGETLLHRNMTATPEALLKAIAPYRDQIVLAAECMFTWYWLADLCAEHGIPFVLGHALSMKAIHGGKAKNDKIDAQKIAVLLRGGMLPQAYVYPAEMRATRDLLRRRMHLARKRGELLAHVHNTNSQYNLPAIGKKIAYKANRDGVAERCADPAVQKSIEVALALITYDDALLRDVDSPSISTASTAAPRPCLCSKRCPASARSSASCSGRNHQIDRFPVCRILLPLVAWSRVPRHRRKRSGTSGTTIGHASQMGVLEAAVFCLRDNR
jgi:hypothetical protein